MWKSLGLLAALAGCAALSLAVPASAQQRDIPTSSRDITSQAPQPAPDNGDIIVRFGESAQIYFKRPIKTVRLGDDLAVRAVPQNDHVVTFTGLAPGRSGLTVESTDGTTDSWGLVTVVREPHEVRMYQRGEINKQSGERRSDSSSAIGGYVALQCNEIRCDEAEPAFQPKLPRLSP